MTDIANNILVPVDLNTPSLVALKQAYLFASKMNLEIKLLYVHEEPGFVGSLFSHESDSILEKIQEELEALARRAAEESGLKVSAYVRKGRVHTHIVDMAETLKSTLIIMGTCGDDERTRNLLGANTSRIIRSSKCPVISVNQDTPRKEIRSILLPLDLTKETRQKVTLATAMARKLGSKIRVVSALWSVNNPEIRAKLEAQMSQVVKFITEEKVECTGEIIEKSKDARTLVPIIINYEHDHNDIDMIMIMTQQEMEVVEFFIGSTAHDIIRKAHVPVMSVVPVELGFISIMD